LAHEIVHEVDYIYINVAEAGLNIWLQQRTYGKIVVNFRSLTPTVRL